MNKLTVLAMTAFFSVSAFSSEAVGFFSNGKLQDSVSILNLGDEVHKLFMQRKRFYSTEELYDVVEDLTRYIRASETNSETLQLGDLSNEHGGNTNEHSSHQNGLDIDIVYLTKNRKLQSKTAPFWQEEFVKNGKVTSNLDTKRNLELFKYAVENHPVRRIFVDEVIKNHFCKYAKDNDLLKDKKYVETLRRLRPAKLHTNHFHVRITCPKDDVNCQDQAEVPAGSGC